MKAIYSERDLCSELRQCRLWFSRRFWERFTLSIAHPVGVATSSSTGGDVSTPDASQVDGLEYERAEVTLDGRVLFQVRGWPAYPADERAKAIRRRIEEIAADSSLALDSLRTVEMEDRTRIVAGDHLVAAFIDADGAVDGVSRQLLAEREVVPKDQWYQAPATPAETLAPDGRKS